MVRRSVVTVEVLRMVDPRASQSIQSGIERLERQLHVKLAVELHLLSILARRSSYSCRRSANGKECDRLPTYSFQFFALLDQSFVLNR
jgi:hypothetical protein